MTCKKTHAIKNQILAALLILLLVTGNMAIANADDNANANNVRVAGKDRYETSFAVANAMHSENGNFPNVVVAYGGNFPDALSGGFLAGLVHGPILLVDKNHESQVLSYIKDHMREGGTTYILGGDTVVRGSFEETLRKAGIKVERISGANRYETNMAILNKLQEGNSSQGGLLIARGDIFPDALSGSSVNMPIMLIEKNLSEAQVKWINNSGIKNFYILGGEGAVSKDVDAALKTLGEVERIGGADRWGTSQRIAERFFDDADTLCLATGDSFPDALSGGPLAANNNAPILLVNKTNWDEAHTFASERKISSSITIGGTQAVTEETVKKVMALSEEEISPSQGADMVNNFAVALLKQTVEEANKPENTLISPISVLYALGMTSNGADGETLRELVEVLTEGEVTEAASTETDLTESKKKQEILNDYLESYLNTISDYETRFAGDSEVSKPALNMANSLWIKDDPKLKVKDEFIKFNENKYKAGVTKTAFDNDALARINKWIEDNTGGTIKNMLTELPEEAIMLLVNALSFEAEWAEQYEDSQVSEGVFHGEEKESTVDFMRSEENSYIGDDQASGFIKYYNGGDYAFAALLPNEGVDIDDYIGSLTGEKLMDILSKPIRHTVIAKTPKFETESSMSLRETLISMGARDAFDAIFADFSRLGVYEENGTNIVIDDVFHKTYIKVNERGTKAGAATVVQMAKATSAGDQEEPYRVTLDRPFIYMLIDVNENIPLFTGVLRNID